MEKFRNKYRIPSARASFWDYGQDAAYFITICTQNREYFFGEIVNGKMNLNELGIMAEKYWFEIPMHFSFAQLDAFVVMPNHVHGILIIDKSGGGAVVDGDAVNDNGGDDDADDGDATVDIDMGIGMGRDASNRVSDHTNTNQPDSNSDPNSNSKPVGGITGNKNPMIHNNIPRIIRWYKGRCSFEMRKSHVDFAWQARYHDHIIRNDNSYRNISNYILNNPLNWKEDKFFR